MWVIFSRQPNKTWAAFLSSALKITTVTRLRINTAFILLLTFNQSEDETNSGALQQEDKCRTTQTWCSRSQVCSLPAALSNMMDVFTNVFAHDTKTILVAMALSASCWIEFKRGSESNPTRHSQQKSRSMALSWSAWETRGEETVLQDFRNDYMPYKTSAMYHTMMPYSTI